LSVVQATQVKSGKCEYHLTKYIPTCTLEHYFSCGTAERASLLRASGLNPNVAERKTRKEKLNRAMARRGQTPQSNAENLRFHIERSQFRLQNGLSSMNGFIRA